MFLRVAEFHRTFNQLVASSAKFPEIRIRDLRKSLLREEVSEFIEAFQQHDTIEIADALADICYIIAGTGVSYGISPLGTYENPYDHHTEAFTIKKSYDEILEMWYHLYDMAEETNNINVVRSTLVDGMMNSVFMISHNMNIPLNEVFTEVHRSNMAKVGPDGVVRYREDGKVLKPATWTPPDVKGVLERHGFKFT